MTRAVGSGGRGLLDLGEIGLTSVMGFWGDMFEARV